MLCKHDPLRFVKLAYPWGETGELSESKPHDWQIKTLEKIRDHLQSHRRFVPLQLAVASGHGIGKSALIAWVMDWAMSTCVDCRVTVTAGTGKQIETKTWPEITKWFKLGINEHWWDVKAESICPLKDKGHERTWRCDVNTWSQNNPGAFAGLHNAGKRIVMIYDEASTIDDVVWEVSSGALTDERTEIIWIAFGNPTETTGRFRECFGARSNRWDNIQIDSRTVPGTNKQLIQEWLEDCGGDEDADFFRVRVRGEFPRASIKQFISGELVLKARKRVCEPRGWRILSVDVAREGDDRTIIGLRQGPNLKILDKLRGRSTVEVARSVMERMREHNPRVTVIDGDGIGGGVIDIIRDEFPKPGEPMRDTVMGRWFAVNRLWALQEFHGGLPANDPFMYFNRRAEAWGRMRAWLETGDIPDAPDVDADLTGLQYGHSSQNAIQLERKVDLKKRGLASPDIGDMLAMSFFSSPNPKDEEELLSERLAAIDDPMWRRIQQVKATLDKDSVQAEDNRPEWMREG